MNHSFRFMAITHGSVPKPRWSKTCSLVYLHDWQPAFVRPIQLVLTHNYPFRHSLFLQCPFGYGKKIQTLGISPLCSQGEYWNALCSLLYFHVNVLSTIKCRYYRCFLDIVPTLFEATLPKSHTDWHSYKRTTWPLTLNFRVQLLLFRRTTS